jgi:hypothetical protein
LLWSEVVLDVERFVPGMRAGLDAVLEEVGASVMWAIGTVAPVEIDGKKTAVRISWEELSNTIVWAAISVMLERERYGGETLDAAEPKPGHTMVALKPVGRR